MMIIFSTATWTLSVQPVRLCIFIVIQHPDHVTLTGPSPYTYMKVFPGVVGYTLTGVPCRSILVMLSIFNNIMVTIYPAPTQNMLRRYWLLGKY